MSFFCWSGSGVRLLFFIEEVEYGTHYMVALPGTLHRFERKPHDERPVIVAFIGYAGTVATFGIDKGRERFPGRQDTVGGRHRIAYLVGSSWYIETDIGPENLSGL